MNIKLSSVFFVIILLLAQTLYCFSTEEDEIELLPARTVQKQRMSILETLDEEEGNVAVICVTYGKQNSDCKVRNFGHAALILKTESDRYMRAHLVRRELLKAERIIGPLDCEIEEIKGNIDLGGTSKVLKGLTERLEELREQKKQILKNNPEYEIKKLRVDMCSERNKEKFRQTIERNPYQIIKKVILSQDQLKYSIDRIREVHSALEKDEECDFKVEGFGAKNCLDFIENVLTPDVFRTISYSKIPYFEQLLVDSEGSYRYYGYRAGDCCLSSHRLCC